MQKTQYVYLLLYIR